MYTESIDSINENKRIFLFENNKTFSNNENLLYIQILMKIKKIKKL